jgi:hypothetical protein
MNRCATVAGMVMSLSLFIGAVHAQVPRQFPSKALRGEVVGTAPPEVSLNGQPARLAPGARIRGPQNRYELTSYLNGKTVIVNYTVEDISGQLMDVWVLTPAEIAKQPWPTTREQARTWLFNPVTQTWTRP